MDYIPDDILIYILEQHENIDFLDILNLSLVSRRFKTIVKLIKPEKIYKIYRKEYLFISERFPNIKFSYDESINENLSESDLKNIEKIKTNNINTISNKLNASILDVSNTIEELNMKDIYNNFKNLESLNLSFCHVNNYPETTLNIKTLKMENFRCDLNEFITFINTKTLIDIDLSYTDISDVSMLNNIKKVNLTNCRNIINFSSLTNVYELILTNTNVSDISFFIVTSILVLDFCIKNLKRIDYLPNLKNLSLMRCDSINDYSQLKNIKTLERLNLYKNNSFENIIDIPENIKYLNISNCYEIKNISELSKFKNLKDLNCSGCLNIYELPFIENLSKLDISYCYDIKKLNIPLSTYYVNADFCHNLCLECDYKNISTLSFFNNEILKDVSILRNIKDINLTNCINIIDVTPLKNCKKIDLSFCDNIMDFNSLLDVYDLNISYCKGLKEFGRFSNNHILNISNCKNISDISKLENVYDLNMSGTNINDISSLNKVTKLNISRCFNIKDISMLENVYNIDLSFCNKITDVSSLVNTVILTIRNHSSHIKGIDTLKKLYYLDVSFSHNIINLDKLKYVFRIIM